MSKVLVIAEHADGKLNAGVAKVVSAAAAIGGDVHVVVYSTAGAGVAAEAAQIAGVSKVLVADHANNDHALAVRLAPQVAALAASGYTHVLFSGTTFGKDVAPRVAAKLGVPQISDVMAVHSASSFDRPIYAGNAITTVEAAPGIVVATVRLASFNAAAAGGAAAVESIATDAPAPASTRFVKLEQQKSARPDLQSANKVGSGGRALGSSGN